MAKRQRLDSLSLTDLHREVRRRERRARRVVDSLSRKRAKILAQLAAIDAEITRHGGSVRSGRGRRGGMGRVRPRNETNLVEALAKVLKSATMSVTDVAAAVQKAGYRTTSPNFRTIVNQTLINSGAFKRVGRGKYTVK